MSLTLKNKTSSIFQPVVDFQMELDASWALFLTVFSLLIDVKNSLGVPSHLHIFRVLFTSTRNAGIFRGGGILVLLATVDANSTLLTDQLSGGHCE